MEYTVIQVLGLSEIITQVNKFIQKGWTPIGGITKDGASFLQAMIRGAKKDIIP